MTTWLRLRLTPISGKILPTHPPLFPHTHTMPPPPRPWHDQRPVEVKEEEGEEEAGRRKAKRGKDADHTTHYTLWPSPPLPPPPVSHPTQHTVDVIILRACIAPLPPSRHDQHFCPVTAPPASPGRRSDRRWANRRAPAAWRRWAWSLPPLVDGGAVQPHTLPAIFSSLTFTDPQTSIGNGHQHLLWFVFSGWIP